MEFARFFEKKKPKKEKRKRHALFLTLGERKELERKAAAVGRGFSVSRYVRTICLYADDPSLKKRPVDYNRLTIAINRVGVNLNQLVKHYNTWGLSEKAARELKRFHQHTHDLLKELIKKL